MGYDSSNLCVPDIKWLGVLPSDLVKYNVPVQCLIPKIARRTLYLLHPVVQTLTHERHPVDPIVRVRMFLSPRFSSAVMEFQLAVRTSRSSDDIRMCTGKHTRVSQTYLDF